MAFSKCIVNLDLIVFDIWKSMEIFQSTKVNFFANMNT